MASLPVNPHFICQRCIRSLQTKSAVHRFALPTSQCRTLRTTSRPRRFAPTSQKYPDANVTKHIVDNQNKPEAYNVPIQRTSAPEHQSLRKVTPTPQPTSTLGPVNPSASHTPDPNFNYYWETLPPTISQSTSASHYFSKTSTPQFLRSVALFRQFPESDVPEVAFVGRSNVGKSSLLNALVNSDIKSLLARTSKTPGCTRTMNLYGVGPLDGVRIRYGKNNGHDRIVGIGGLMVVDLPGYGEGSLSEWGVEIMKYLTQRKQLRRVFVLIDAVAGIKDGDRSLLMSLRSSGVPHQVVLSKLDKIYIPEGRSITHFANPKSSKGGKKLKPAGSINKLREIMGKIKEEIQPPHSAGALGELLGVSSEVMVDGKKLGVDAVRVAVLQAAGVRYETKQSKKVSRTVKTNAPIEEVMRRRPKKAVVRTMKTDTPVARRVEIDVPIETRRVKAGNVARRVTAKVPGEGLIRKKGYGNAEQLVQKREGF